VVEHITDRKLAEAKYLRELKFNETLVDHTSVIIVLLDRQGRMEHVNQATVDILGYSRKELLGRTPWAVGIMDPEEKLRAMERLQVLLKGGGSNPPRETILKAKDGKPHVFSLSSVATNAPDGTVDRIIVTGTDLTERNRMQREILKISEQEQARIGHNLHDGVGQTMTGVATLIEALESELEGRQRDSAERIRQLIQQAIQEVRRMSHSMSPAAVKNRGLGGVLQLLAETIRINHRTQCVCEVDSSVHIRDSEMETHIYRIAQEAANNAIRHGKPAKISISLKRHSDRECVLTIEDDGSGISKASRKAGHGIGMQVMDYRANLIGGSLKIAAKPRRGVRVTCRFPCDSSQARKP
jgi:PAS domain S-box-containing protein